MLYTGHMPGVSLCIKPLLYRDKPPYINFCYINPNTDFCDINPYINFCYIKKVGYAKTI